MTCIAGYTDGRDMTIMGDSCASWDGCTRMTLAESKVWGYGEGRHPAILVGASGTPRLLQVLRYLSPAPGYESDRDQPIRMILRWVEALRPVFAAHGLVGKDDRIGAEKCGHDVGILVGTAGRWFDIDSSWSITAVESAYAATGCGANEALAAIHAQAALAEGMIDSRDLALVPENILRRALGASAHFNSHVRPPFVYVTVPVGEGV